MICRIFPFVMEFSSEKLSSSVDLSGCCSLSIGQTEKNRFISAIQGILINFFFIQLHHFLRQLSFNNSAGEQVSFGPNGELLTGFDILNWVIFPNKSFLRVQVGKIDPMASPDKFLTISEKEIIWPHVFNQVCFTVCFL